VRVLVRVFLLAGRVVLLFSFSWQGFLSQD